MEEYLEQYGRHFSKSLYNYAVSEMKDRNGNAIPPMTKEQVSERLKSNNVTLKHDVGFDAVYVWSMAMADYWGSSITDEAHLARYVKDYLDDPDGSETKAFDHYYSDCIALGCPIFWREML